MATDGYRLRSVRVVGAASPEGSARFNSELSKLRAGSICDYFANRGLRPDSLSVDYRGRDWSGLLQLVNDDESVPARAEVMRIVEGVIASGFNEAEVGNRALARLKRLGGGSAYGYIYTRLFPKLRSSRLFVEYEPAGNRQPLYVDVITSPEPDSLPEPDAMIEQEIAEGVTFTPEENHRRLYMGLKTNMLYDALALPILLKPDEQSFLFTWKKILWLESDSRIKSQRSRLSVLWCGQEGLYLCQTQRE